MTKYCKTNVAGFLLQKELDYLDGAVSNPSFALAPSPGGSKVSSKIGVIESLLQKTDKIILGGGMIFTFYKALGKSVGASLVEDDKIDLAKELMAKAEAKGVKLLLSTTPSSPTSSPRTPTRKSSPLTTFRRAGWVSTSVRTLSRASKPNSTSASPSSGTARWASSRWMPSPRVPSPRGHPRQPRRYHHHRWW